MIVNIIFILLSLFTPKSTGSDLHDFHLSKCEIHYSEEENALQISLKIFIDDLEEAIANVLQEENLKLCTSKELVQADSIMVSYLADTFIMSVDHQAQQLEYVGKEPSDDLLAVWCYFEIVDVDPKEIIEVENKILIETFDDQSNIVAMKYSDSKQEYFMLKKGDTSGTLVLN